MLDPLKFVLAGIVPILMMSKKLAALGLLETKIFQNKGYDVIISVHDVNNNILSRDLKIVLQIWSCDQSLATFTFLC